MSKLKKIAYSLPLSLPEFDHDTTRKASSLQTKLPNGHEKFDEFGGEQLYEKFFDILKTQGKVVLENTIQSYQETDEGAKLISNLKFYVDNCGVEEPEHAVISGIITKTTKKKLRRRSEKETLNPTLPDSFIKLDKTEENQDNTHTKSFNHFFLPTPEQQREAQLEAENLSLKEQLAELEKQLEETKAVLAALIEENRLKLAQIKELELRVEEAESVAFKSRENNKADSLPDNAPKIMLPEIDDEYDRLKNWLEERGWLEQITYYNPKKKTEPKEEIVCKADYRFLTRDTEKETAETIYDDIFKDWLVAGNHIFQFYLGGKKGLMPKLLQGLKNQLKHSLNKSIPPKKNWVDKTIQDEDYKKLNRKVMALRLRM